MAVIRSKDYPLAPKDRAWDADAADARVRRWAGGPDKDNIDWDKYRSCHLWYDAEAPEDFGSYRFLYVDIIDGEPQVVFRALAAIIAVLNGARGGTNIPDSDRKGVYREAARQYRRFDEEPPELQRSGLAAIERRIVPAAGIELRAEDGAPYDGTGQAYITWYPAVFNQPTDLGYTREVVRPGAFAKTLKDGADVRALVNHNPDYVLGRTKSGTLELAEDEKGLRARVAVPNTSWAKDLLETLKRGDVDQGSFGFTVMRDRWERDEYGNSVRELIEVALFDVSIVTFPAYPQTEVTEVQVRSAIAELQASIDSLRRLLPTAAPPLAGHPANAKDAPKATSNLALRRRKLALIEREID